MNTKARHREIYAAAVLALENAGGVEAIDALSQSNYKPQLKIMVDFVIAETATGRDTARRNVAKAMKRERFALMQQEAPDNWGGPRPNQKGPPPMPEDEKRQRVSTLLGPGYKELAQAIAQAWELPGWGYAVERALDSLVDGDRELREKLTEMGIIIKSKE